MFKLVGWLVVLAATFGAGYYVGQHSLNDLRQKVAELSRTVKDTTLGFERSMRLRQGLMDAKADVIEAKSQLLDKNFGNATTQLAQAVEHLQKAAEAEQDAGRLAKVKPLVAKAKELRQDLSSGKPIAKSTLDEIQKDLDKLLN